MAGLSPSLPLVNDSTDGFYKLLKEHIEVVKQNFKNLMLTAPGERVMDPDFGVGLRNYLFEQNTPDLQGIISAKIQEQVSIYMPFVRIVNISFYTDETDRDIVYDPNKLKVKIEYEIVPLEQIDELEI